MAQYGEEIDGFVFRKLGAKSSKTQPHGKSGEKRQRTNAPAFSVPKLPSRLRINVHGEQPSAKAQKMLESLLEKQISDFKRANKLGNMASTVDTIFRRFLAEASQVTIDTLNRRKSLSTRKPGTLIRPNPANELCKKRIAVLEALKTGYKNELRVWEELDEEIQHSQETAPPPAIDAIYPKLAGKDLAASLAPSQKAMDSVVLRTDTLKRQLREARRRSAECLEAAKQTSESFHSYALAVMGADSTAPAGLVDASKLLQEIVQSKEVDMMPSGGEEEMPSASAAAEDAAEPALGNQTPTNSGAPIVPRTRTQRRDRLSVGSTGSRRRSSIAEEPTPPVMRKILRGRV